MTGVVVKRNEQEFHDWLKDKHEEAASRASSLGLDPEEILSTEVGWLLTLPKYEGKFLDFDSYQARFLTIPAKRRSVLKARQVGFSFEIAAESLSRCHLKEKHRSVCVSYNLDDAKEKIALVKELHEELPLDFQKKMVIDSKTEVGFASNTRKRRIAKVISYPSKAPRGKSGDVYLDELAHCQNDRQLYAGATAVTIRSGGQLTIGSTPLGQRGMFHMVHTQTVNFPGYWRQEVPWWLCRQFCNDVPEAARLAPHMATQDRVALYGTPALRQQLDDLPIEDFQQEFELAFQDERVSFFPYDLIQPSCVQERHEIPVYSNLDMLARHANDMGPLFLGYDVGRTTHPSELFVFEDRKGEFVLRYEEQFKNVSFPDQRARLTKILERLGDHYRKFRIDRTGMGRNLAEDLRLKFGPRVVEVHFTREVKEDLANNLKILFQERAIVLPKCRALIGQIHSIKQKITAAGNSVFDAERNRFHHADKMWAIALAVSRKRGRRKVVPKASVRVLQPEPKKLALPSEALESVMERAFDVPAELNELKAEQKRVALAQISLERLEQRSRAVLISRNVYVRSGDDHTARRLHAEYKRLRRAIRKKQKSS